MFKEMNILKLFFEYPTQRFNVREAAKKLRISPATASKKLKDKIKRFCKNRNSERRKNKKPENILCQFRQ